MTPRNRNNAEDDQPRNAPPDCPGLSCRLALTQWAARQLDNQSDAEDLAGDICVHCMRGRGRFRAEAEFSTWLRSVATNALRDFLKAKCRRAGLATGGLSEAEIHGAAQFDYPAGPDTQRLYEAMRSLTPRQRHLIEWKYGEGLTYAEIAARLNTSNTAVSQALRRARLALKRAIESDDLCSS